MEKLQYFSCKAPSWFSAFYTVQVGTQIIRCLHLKSDIELIVCKDQCECGDNLFEPVFIYSPLSIVLSSDITCMSAQHRIRLDPRHRANRKQITGLTAWWDKLSSWAEMLDGWSWSLAWCWAGYKLQVISKIMEKLLSVCVLSRTHH